MGGAPRPLGVFASGAACQAKLMGVFGFADLPLPRKLLHMNRIRVGRPVNGWAAGGALSALTHTEQRGGTNHGLTSARPGIRFRAMVELWLHWRGLILVTVR